MLGCRNSAIFQLNKRASYYTPPFPHTATAGANVRKRDDTNRQKNARRKLARMTKPGICDPAGITLFFVLGFVSVPDGEFHCASCAHLVDIRPVSFLV